MEAGEGVLTGRLAAKADVDRTARAVADNAKPKTRERVTAHASLQLEQLRRVGASDLATVRLADHRIVEPARGAAEVLERVVDRET